MSAEANPRAAYLDSSAIVKLVVREPETPALMAFLDAWPVRVTSALARVEVARAVRRYGDPAGRRVAIILDGLGVLALDNALLDAAATIDLEPLRSLDAIHIASAKLLDSDLGTLVTYDARMIAAALSLGLPVSEPVSRPADAR
jgi:uncharacterized protein